MMATVVSFCSTRVTFNIFLVSTGDKTHCLKERLISRVKFRVVQCRYFGEGDAVRKDKLKEETESALGDVLTVLVSMDELHVALHSKGQCLIT